MRALVGVIVAVGCSNGFGDLPAAVSRVEIVEFEVWTPPMFDVLFVIDDSPAMAASRAHVAGGLAMVGRWLDEELGWQRDLRIGVVTTDLGSGGAFLAGNCFGDGRAGAMRRVPLVDGPFLVDHLRPDRSRNRNYDGDLAAAFAALTDVGVTGCEFPRPLEAMRRALDGTPGFLRDDADLVVAFVTAQDDCSFATPAFLGGAPALGPLDPFRCATQAIACESDRCGPRASPYLTSVGSYAAYLKQLRPHRAIVSAIAGPPTPVVFGDHTLAPSCQSDDASATPAVRLAAFADAFFDRNIVSSICDDDLAEGLDVFSNTEPVSYSDACVDRRVGECSVVDVDRDGATASIPPCGAAAEPCWRLVDNTTCLQGRELHVDRVVFPRRGTVTHGECVVEDLGFP